MTSMRWVSDDYELCKRWNHKKFLRDVRIRSFNTKICFDLDLALSLSVSLILSIIYMRQLLDPDKLKLNFKWSGLSLTLPVHACVVCLYMHMLRHKCDPPFPHQPLFFSIMVNKPSSNFSQIQIATIFTKYSLFNL